MLRSLFKETLWYGVAGASSRLVGVVLIPLYTRAFSPSEYGLLEILLTTSYMLVLFSGLQVESGLGRSYFEAKKQDRQHTLLFTSMWLCLGGALLCGLLLFLSYPWIPPQWFGHSSHLVVALGVITLPSQLLNLLQVVLRLERKLKSFLIISIGDVLTSAILSVVLVVYAQGGVLGVLIALGVSKSFWVCYSLVSLTPFRGFAFEKTYAKEILLYSLPTVPGTLLFWAQSSISRYILAAYMSMADVGIFGLAVKISSIMALLLTAFRMAWYPYSMESMQEKDFGEKCARMMELYWGLGFLVCALVTALSSLAISILAPPAYLDATRLVGLVTFGVLWSGVPQMVGLGVDYTRKTYLALIAYIAGVLVNVLVLVWCVKYWGLLAAGLSALLGYGVSAFVLLTISQKQFWMPYKIDTFVYALGCSLAYSVLCFLMPTPAVGLGPVTADVLMKLALAAGFSLVMLLKTMGLRGMKYYLKELRS